jgi:hypothetical protein
VWLGGLGQLKNPVILSGIEPATFRLVACENNLSIGLSAATSNGLSYHADAEPERAAS